MPDGPDPGDASEAHRDRAIAKATPADPEEAARKDARLEAALAELAEHDGVDVETLRSRPKMAEAERKDARLGAALEELAEAEGLDLAALKAQTRQSVAERKDARLEAALAELAAHDDSNPDDIMRAHREREEVQRKDARLENALEELRRHEVEQAAMAPPKDPTEAPEATAKPSQPGSGLSALAGGPQGDQNPEALRRAGERLEVAGRVGNAFVPYPTQVIGGVLSAVEEIPAFFRDAGEWVTSWMPRAGLVFGGDEWVKIETGEVYEDVALGNLIVEAVESAVPDIAGREDGGGSIARGIAQFLTGFVATRKLPGMAELAKAGRAGQFSSAALRGAVADMASFDPHEARLANLIEAYPELDNPVTAYLAADPDDSGAEGRFKNALEGLGLGTLAEGLFRGVRAIAQARRLKAEAEPLEAAAGEMELLEETTRVQRSAFEELLGDPERPLFDITPVEGVSSRDVLESADSGAARAPAAAARGTKGEEGAEIMVNWSRIDSSDDVKAVMQDFANLLSDRVDEARGGRHMSFEQMKLDAAEVDAFDALARRREGDPLPAHEALAARELWGRSSRKLLELSVAVEANPSDVNQIALRKMMSVHAAIQEQVIAARTATARAQASWRIPMGDTADFVSQMDQLQALLTSEKNTVKLAQGIRRLHELDRVDAADAFVYGSRWARTGDAIAQLFYFSILSGPHTQARNLISNAATIPLQVVNRRVASWLSQTVGSGDVSPEESAVMLSGLFNGLRDAFRISHAGRQVLRNALEQPAFAGDTIRENADEFGGFWRSVATGDSGFGVGKVDERMLGSFDPEKWRVARESPIGSVLAVLDTATTVPMRALTAGDEIFKTANHRMELHAQAVRKALGEVRAGTLDESEYADRVTKLVNEPDESMRLAAMDFARESTFTLSPARDSRAYQFIRSTSHLPVVGKLAMPFTRIVYNLGRFTFRHTPLAVAMHSYRDAIKRGGADADIARAQLLTGSALLAVAADFTLQGRLTGEGPPDPAERAYLRRSGWKPNSVAVGPIESPRYFSLRGLEPVGGLFTMGANLTELLAAAAEDDNPELDEVVMATTLAMANQLTMGNYMYGAANTIEALSDPVRYGEGYFERLSATLAPTALATVTYANDPIVREVESMIDAAKARVPGLSKTLPARRDLWGRPITRESGLGSTYDALSPLYSKKWDPEPIDEELARNDAYLRPPSKKVSIDGVTVDLANYPGAYSEYLKIAGQEIRSGPFGTPIIVQGSDRNGVGFGLFRSKGGTLVEELNDLVSGKAPESSLFHSLSDGPDGGKVTMIRRIVREYQALAREELLERRTEIRQFVNDRNYARAGRAGSQAAELEATRQALQGLQ